MKNIFLIFAFLTIASCSKGPTAPPDACSDQSMDFESCLSCCQDKGYNGASLPIDNSGNRGVCECVE